MFSRPLLLLRTIQMLLMRCWGCWLTGPLRWKCPHPTLDSINLTGNSLQMKPQWMQILILPLPPPPEVIEIDNNDNVVFIPFPNLDIPPPTNTTQASKNQPWLCTGFSHSINSVHYLQRPLSLSPWWLPLVHDCCRQALPTSGTPLSHCGWHSGWHCNSGQGTDGACVTLCNGTHGYIFSSQSNWPADNEAVWLECRS